MTPAKTSVFTPNLTQAPRLENSLGRTRRFDHGRYNDRYSAPKRQRRSKNRWSGLQSKQLFGQPPIDALARSDARRIRIFAHGSFPQRSYKPN